jgi:hypothetical protein
MIPERVEIVSSITTGRTCDFKTPFGTFSYQKRETRNYAIGILRQEIGKTGYLIASPEKALYDKVYLDSRFTGGSKSEIKLFLAEDLRLDMDKIKLFDATILRQLFENSRGRMRAFVKSLLE